MSELDKLVDCNSWVFKGKTEMLFIPQVDLEIARLELKQLISSNEELASIKARIAELEEDREKIIDKHISELADLHVKITEIEYDYLEYKALTQWQPIETAPKDGTVIRVSDLLGRERLASWYKESKYFDGHWMLRLEKIPEITHWMPLPKPPEEK